MHNNNNRDNPNNYHEKNHSTNERYSSFASVSKIQSNFGIMCICVSTVLGTTVTCLALATAELGETLGSLQSAILYATYTLAAVSGMVTKITTQYGPRNTLCIGMILLVGYVLSFGIVAATSTTVPSSTTTTTTDETNTANNNNDNSWTDATLLAIVIVTAAVGGIGAGLLWTAQGTYLAQAAVVYATSATTTTTTTATNFHNPDSQQQSHVQPPSPTTYDIAQASSRLAGWFAFCFLTLETCMECIATVLTAYANLHWSIVFGLYAVLAMVATIVMPYLVYDYRNPPTGYGPDGYIIATTTALATTTDGTNDVSDDVPDDGSSTRTDGIFCPTDETSFQQPHNPLRNHNHSTQPAFTTAWRFIQREVRVVYLGGITAAFSLAGAWLNAFVNGQIVPTVFGNADMVGGLVALHGATAAIVALLGGYYGSDYKLRFLVAGAMCFAGMATLYIVHPNIHQWHKSTVVTLYLAQGVGRATYEGTLRAVFADYFHSAVEDAFAVLIVQNGIGAVVGFVLSMGLPCLLVDSVYCIDYNNKDDGDGSSSHRRSQFFFSLLIICTSSMAIWGILEAARTPPPPTTTSPTAATNPQERIEMSAPSTAVAPRRSLAHRRIWSARYDAVSVATLPNDGVDMTTTDSLSVAEVL
jgi:MFS family permease